MFQKTIDVTQLTVKWQFAFACLKDFVAFLKILEEQIYHMKHVLTLLNNAAAMFKRKKTGPSRTRSITLDTLYDPGGGKLQHTQKLKFVDLKSAHY